MLPFLASDEEGGTVQRLREVIYRAAVGRDDGHLAAGPGPAYRRATTRSGCGGSAYGWTSRRSPTSPCRGEYIDSLGRAFSADPERVAAADRAWRLGMRDARVVTVLKHWPGHGSATNSHTGPARVPPLAELEGRDLLPFERELADGAPVVMVGHLLSRGLTTGDGVPTSLSPRALRYLRRVGRPGRRGAHRLAGDGGGQLVAGDQPRDRATVRALRAGADWAMACDASPLRAVTAVRAGPRRGSPRPRSRPRPRPGGSSSSRRAGGSHPREPTRRDERRGDQRHSAG